MEAVLAVPVAVGFGYWADTHFETSPRYLLVGAVIGFFAMVVRLVRMGPGDGSAQAGRDPEAAPADAEQNGREQNGEEQSGK